MAAFFNDKLGGCSCARSKCSDECSTYRNFKAKVLTNADRVRQMSDAEIEDWYWWMHKKMMQFTDSRIFVHEWLKSPVEVDNGT